MFVCMYVCVLFRGGYNGFSDSEQYKPIDLTLDAVEHIHHEVNINYYYFVNKFLI